ncbi:MAG: ubiquinol-cytochrome c reductase iron-sulfur subunit [Desulfomonile sp.]|nr:ubiquinol-cytochrome c reductase iron-sulfur subunit [Desulfomonile sp.]
MPKHSESKRSFLRLTTLLLGACAALLGLWGAIRFALFGGASARPREFPMSVLESLQAGIPMHVPEAGAWLIKGGPADITALDDRCTHLGCRYRWEAEQQLFACPCHGSEFASDGSVLKGPATRPLIALTLNREEQGKIRLLEGKG